MSICHSLHLYGTAWAYTVIRDFYVVTDSVTKQAKILKN